MNHPRTWIALVVVVGVGAAIAFLAYPSRGTQGRALDQAWDEARRGRIAEADAILQNELSGDRQPTLQVEALRIRIIAAKGNVRHALIELVRSEHATQLETLMAVLGTLHERLEREGIDTQRSDGALARYALGFGGVNESVEAMQRDARTVIDAIRSHETGRTVDIAALQAIADDSNELPRFIRVVEEQTPSTAPSRKPLD